jgi:hypothetical protein
VGGGIGGAQDLAVVEDDSLHKNRVQGHRAPGTGQEGGGVLVASGGWARGAAIRGP